MNNRPDKYQWLQYAFSDYVGSINEGYYYDALNNEFFSVFITDYFLIDQTSTNALPGNPYTETELKALKNRIKRLENKDSLILEIPRLTVQERKEMMQEFIRSHPLLKNQGELQKIIDIEDGRTNLDFKNLMLDEQQVQWQQFKSQFIRNKIDTFCNLHDINIDSASLWTDDKMTSMSLGLDNNLKELTVPKKTWWKFW